MTAPSYPPAIADIATVKAYLRLTDATDDALITELVGAVNALMVGYFASDALAVDGWPANQSQGAVMLAARLYRRRNSPAGVEALGELGPVYVSRNDPDIAQLIGLGAYLKPAVG